jgi:hypothetical protein
MRRATPGKYEPLAAYLAALPADAGTITLPLSDLEQILGAPPPPPTWTRSFWSNCRSVRRSRCWLDAGWRVAHFNRMRGVVTFTRGAPQAGPERGAEHGRR